MEKYLVLFIIFGLSIADNVEEFTKANNLLFTPAVYKQLLKANKGNFLMSPLSAEIAISLAGSGCKGDTASEIRHALHILPHDEENFESAIKTLLPTLKGNDSYTVYAPNKIYVKENFTVNDSFEKIATKIYDAETENIDFAKSKEAAETINNWVENKTESKIHNLISSNDLDNSTRLILINALYFKGDWAKPFKLANTRRSQFYDLSEKSVKVNMMHFKGGFFNYYESLHLNAKIVEVPLKGKDAYMVFVLPNKKLGLADLEQKIDEVFIPQNFTRTRVNIALPKFKIDKELDFKQILKKLGVHKAFNETEADLSGISGKPGDLIIDKIKQKSFIDVSEKGVEAAAATFVLIGSPRSGGYKYPYKEFIADHPFIFFLRVRGFIFFAGRVTSPKY